MVVSSTDEISVLRRERDIYMRAFLMLTEKLRAAGPAAHLCWCRECREARKVQTR